MGHPAVGIVGDRLALLSMSTLPREKRGVVKIDEGRNGEQPGLAR